jgi:hypothetical protein
MSNEDAPRDPSPPSDPAPAPEPAPQHGDRDSFGKAQESIRGSGSLYAEPIATEPLGDGGLPAMMDSIAEPPSAPPAEPPPSDA